MVLGAAVPVLAAALLLIAPGAVFSRDMTWDLLFNLSGAWHIHNGHVPHVDFHDPLGPLNFQLTRLGFRIVGTTPFGFLAAEFIALAALFAAAAAAAIPRLPPVPALIFVVTRVAARRPADQRRRFAERLLVCDVLQPLGLERPHDALCGRCSSSRVTEVAVGPTRCSGRCCWRSCST